VELGFFFFFFKLVRQFTQRTGENREGKTFFPLALEECSTECQV